MDFQRPLFDFSWQVYKHNRTNSTEPVFSDFEQSYRTIVVLPLIIDYCNISLIFIAYSVVYTFMENGS